MVVVLPVVVEEVVVEPVVVDEVVDGPRKKEKKRNEIHTHEYFIILD